MISYVISISGGKDSTAMALHLLRERELKSDRIRLVTFDTGWEHPATYAYIQYLREKLDRPIEVRARYPKRWSAVLEEQAQHVESVLDLDANGTARRSPMVRWCLSRAMFPSRMRKFCTQEMKLHVARDVMREEHAAGYAPVNAIGIRAGESPARSKLTEHDLWPKVDAMVWRPLIAWTEQDVIDCHARHGVLMNPLYAEGANRVGCWPCIQAGKDELRLLAFDEQRIRAMELLEQYVAEGAEARAQSKGKPYTNPPAFFQRVGKGRRSCEPIRTHLEWAQTAHGGRQMDMLALVRGEPACLSAGLCAV